MKLLKGLPGQKKYSLKEEYINFSIFQTEAISVK